jgi:hypothetical protein
MKAIMSKEIREATRDPKQRKELQEAIAKLVSKPGNKDGLIISIGDKKYKISTPDAG